MFKILCFLSLTDKEILDECGSYDKMLVVAMFLRQLTTFVFTFLIFTYGVSLFLDETSAIVCGSIFSLVIFFLDQSIIGSEWAMRNPFEEGIQLKPIIGFVPRLFYSLIIAVGLATLAEIGIQYQAIDEKIQQETRKLNQEYNDKIDSYEKEINQSIAITQQKISDNLDKRKKVKEATKYYSLESVQSEIKYKHSLIKLKYKTLVSVREKINTLHKDKDESIKLKKYWENEMNQEDTGYDSRASGKGPKYRYASKKVEQKNLLIIRMESELKAKNKEEKNIENSIDLLNKDVNKLGSIKEILSGENTIYNDDLLSTELTHKSEDKQEKIEKYRKILSKQGILYKSKNGFLHRYIALKKIHSDNEIGESAKQFSQLLKVFFISLELMPVIIKIFFTPFSLYSLKMYVNMKTTLLEEEENLRRRITDNKVNRKVNEEINESFFY